MARYLTLWRQNPAVPMPSDPSEALKLNEQMFAVLDDLLKKGVVEDFGFFQDTGAGGVSGYTIDKGEATDSFRSALMFLPYILVEVHEIISYEKGKEVMMGFMRSRVEAAKK